MGTILLTGAGGYLGGCVLALGRGRGLDLVPLEGRLEAIAPGSLPVEAVIHCAGARRHRGAGLDATNRQGTEALLAGLRGAAPIIHVSSSSVYAPAPGALLDEAAPVGTPDLYGASKLAAEGLVASSGRPFVIFRPTALFGQGCGGWGDAFPGRALGAFLEGRRVLLHQPDRKVDYLRVGTLADLLLDALRPGPHWGCTFNAAGPARSLHGLLEAFGRVVDPVGGCRALMDFRPGPPSAFPLLSTRRLEGRFGPLAQPGDEAIAREMLRCGPS